MSPRTVDKEARKNEILDAALSIISKKGAFDFKIIEVARKAKIGKGTIYEYFSSKEQLIFGAFRRFMERHLEHLHPETPEKFTPRGHMKDFIERSLRFFASNKRLLQVLFDLWSYLQRNREVEKYFGDLAELMASFKANLMMIYKAGIESGEFRKSDPNVVVTGIFAMIDGLALQYQMNQIDLTDPEVIREISEVITDGICSKPDGNKKRGK